MRRKVEVSEIAETASDVWAFLKKQGGLDTKRYDIDLVEELRSGLDLPSVGDIETLLVTEDVSTQDFVVAFFQAVQPYAAMMSDLLKMFEKAGAKQTDKNLAVRFEFDGDLPELSFDLSHFRSWSEIWERVAGTYLTNLWDFKTIWALNSAVRGWNLQVRDSRMRRWLHEYMEERIWPDFLPPAPRSGDPGLDVSLAKTWRVWTRVVEESSRYGRSRNILHDIAFGPQQDSSLIEQADCPREGWSPRFLGGIDSDHWAGSLGRGAYCAAETISSLPHEERRGVADELRGHLEEVFAGVPNAEIDGELLIRSLEEFLKLPIWQRRHELYSAWISTQLVNALERYSVRIHQTENTLVFSFSGTHLATADAFEPRLHVWAELRSPLADPVGKSRKKAIQPDYSLITDPVTVPKTSILEVECKQYHRPSARNFADALTDYAKGRPNAQIVLVNYGPVNESALDRVEPTIRHRTKLIGMMRPGSTSAQEEFRQLVLDAVSDCGLVAAPVAQPVSKDASDKVEIRLVWEATPRDLDLHVRISTAGKSDEVCYSEMGSTTEEPWAQLDKDVQSGQGPETIEVLRWMKGQYQFAVHNYSDDASLAGCGAKIAFTQGERLWRFECPRDGMGKWWSVFVLDTDSREVEVINRIVEQPW